MPPKPAPCLPGDAATDYERYLRTDTLLSLQKPPGERGHRDELLFQVVHQTSELWLKLASEDLEAAAGLVAKQDFHQGTAMVRRALQGLDQVIAATHMLENLTAASYTAFRDRLGHGSGYDSPGFRTLRTMAARLENAAAPAAPAAPDAGPPGITELLQAMLGFDQRVGEWRYLHFRIIERLLGRHATGLLGSPVDQLCGMLLQPVFPSLRPSPAPAAPPCPVHSP